MKSSLLTRVAPVMLLSATLAGGLAMPGYAQTTSTAPATPGAAANPPAPNTGTPAAPGTTSGTMGTSQAAPETHAPSASTENAPSGSAENAPNGSAQNTPENAPSRSLEQMAEQRIQSLHRRLRITQKEEPKWQTFARTMRDNARALDKVYQQRAEKIDSMSAVENMRSFARIERMRADDVQKLVAPFESLYAALSPQQRREADELFRARAEAARQRHQGSTAASQSGH